MAKDKKYLVIVESPTKARTLKRYLGKDFEIDASMGHVRDLPKSKLGVDVENDFEPEYVKVRGKGKVVTKLKKEAKEADEIILAMDPDREGEAIAWHVKHLLQNGKGKKKQIPDDKFKRVTFHEITKGAILKAMEEPGEIQDDLVNAQQARRVLDRLVGYTLSPVLWKKVRRGLSAGRVQSVALRLIVEKEEEREAFDSEEYWEVKVKLDKQQVKSKKQKDEFEELEEGQMIVDLWEVNGKKIQVRQRLESVDNDAKKHEDYYFLDNKEDAEAIVAHLKDAGYSVVEVEKKERKRNAYPPYITSTLQRGAATKLGWTGKQTMRAAQQLYEAGLITYHRTDSVNLSSTAVDAARKLIEKEFGSEYLPKKPNHYKTKSKSAQEAHEAIRPTDVKKREVSEASSKLNAQHQKLYDIIWKRFVSSQMTPTVYDQTAISIKAVPSKAEKAPDYLLRASGSVIKFLGWRRAWGKKQVGGDVLPNVSENDELYYIDLLDEQKFTQPPARYNDASLVKELEARGIGRPSTYASIISVLEDRGYVNRENRAFVPTTVGQTVVKFLKKHFTEVMDYDFTAEMEDDLDAIARNEKEWKKVLKGFWGPFDKRVEKAEDAEREQIPVEKTGEECPECKEGEVVIREGKYGKFKSCSRFPECKYSANLIEKLDDFECPECGSDVVIKRTRRGKQFYGCSSYPKCEWASWKDPRQKK